MQSYNVCSILFQNHQFKHRQIYQRLKNIPQTKLAREEL